MTTIQTLSIVCIAATVAGIFAPMLIKWIIKRQTNWRFKPIKNNGRFDLVDEFNYWYGRLVRERQSLEEAAAKPEAREVGEEVGKAIAARLDMLNKFLASRISGDKKLDAEAADELEQLIENRQQFMDSTRMAFTAAHPDLIHYLEDKGLTTREINYCCLYLIGLRAKEIGNYLSLRSHYNISSSIRAKLGLESNATNLGIYLRKLMSGEVEFATTQSDPQPKYTPRQLRGALLNEILFDYLGLMLVACAYLHDNLMLEICVLATAALLIILGVRVLIFFRSDIKPVVKLISSMNQFGALQIIGSAAIILLFADTLIPAAAHPYIGYPALIASQLLPLAALYRYAK